MKKLVVDKSKVTLEKFNEIKKICPFDGLEYVNDTICFTAGCKMCGLCAKKSTDGMIKLITEESETIDKTKWKGISVFVQVDDDHIHPVTLELIGKAKELASVINDKVFAILITSKKNKESLETELLAYGVDVVYSYINDLFKDFNVELYSRCINDFINKIKPNTILYGATSLGRSLAPRVAKKVNTGLTADCTSLGMKENTDLIQIRPAFGGNVMAQIVCTNTRPQMATVRYKVFPMPKKQEIKGYACLMSLDDISLKTNIKLISKETIKASNDISDFDVVVACGKAFTKPDDLKIAYTLADALKGTVASTRALVEAGLMDIKHQIGLSGKTISPKLIICLGISGAIQFVSGMSQSDVIIAINKDQDAPIFNYATLGIVGDVFEIVPKLIEKILNN